jgi:membrane protease YdiL (CAAX protease family)
MSASATNFAILALLLVVIAPIAEEIFFRGFLYRLLRQYLPAWATIAVSACAFAALHGAPSLFPWLFFMGLVFGYVVEKTGSLYSSIVIHAMVNGLAMVGIVVALSGW